MAYPMETLRTQAARAGTSVYAYSHSVHGAGGDDAHGAHKVTITEMDGLQRRCTVQIFTFAPPARAHRNSGGKRTRIDLPSIFPSSSLIDRRKQSEYEGVQFMYEEENCGRALANKSRGARR